MKQIDLDAYRQYFPEWAKGLEGEIETVALLSGNPEQEQVMNSIFTWPEVVILEQKDWDLSFPSARPKFDLVFAANVFMYSPDPVLWFKNALAGCRYFWIQDIVVGRRMSDVELGSDGDSSRYVGPGVTREPASYVHDVRTFGQVDKFRTYGEDEKHISFLAQLRERKDG